MSSVQIISNKVVQIGDWIAMPKYNADGEVKKISLTLIKVQNSDKTISTIPTHAVLSESFQNWSGVESAGGRRIKRSILIDMRQIRVCTPEMIARFERMELIGEYLGKKKVELEEYNRNHDTKASPVNSRQLTNIGTFRAYLDAYLRNHPGLNKDMSTLVRHLQPSSSGLPIEIYAFASSTEWSQYEAVQADVFDHVLAILPEFWLRAFQDLTESAAAVPDSDPELQAVHVGLAEIESLIDSENRDSEERPRARPVARLERVRKHISSVDLSDYFGVELDGRKIALRHLKN